MIGILVGLFFVMICEKDPNQRDKNWKIIVIVMMLFWLLEMLFSCSY